MAWLPKKKVVAPIDFSDESFAAVDVVRENFIDDAGGLYLIHVLPPLEPNEPGVIWKTVDDASRRKHVAEAVAAKLTDPKYAGYHLEVAVGSPGAEIAAYAEKIKAELIVMPSSGRTGLIRMFLGSVADRVTRLAPCPVLILRD